MNVKMSIPQWNDYSLAVKNKDVTRAKRIMDMGHVPDYNPSMADETAKELAAPTEYEPEDIMGDVAAGLENSEICAKYGISVQKLGSIKKKAK